MTNKDKLTSSFRPEDVLGHDKASAKNVNIDCDDKKSGAEVKKPVARGVSGSDTDKFFEPCAEKSWTQPNRGMDANAVESLVFGCQDEPTEDALLMEFERSAAATKDGGANFIFEFDNVPQALVFSEFATYKLLKRKTRRVFYINGKSLESRIGLDNALYEQVKTRTRKAFCVGDDIIAFESLRVEI